MRSLTGETRSKRLFGPDFGPISGSVSGAASGDPFEGPFWGRFWAGVGLPFGPFRAPLLGPFWGPFRAPENYRKCHRSNVLRSFRFRFGNRPWAPFRGPFGARFRLPFGVRFRSFFGSDSGVPCGKPATSEIVICITFRAISYGFRVALGPISGSISGVTFGPPPREPFQPIRGLRLGTL